MKNIKIVLTGVLLAAGMGYSELMTRDFTTGESVGANPTGTKYISPTAITASSYVKVVGSTPMGTGNGLAIYDNDTANIGLEYNFTAATAVRVDMAFSPVAGGTAASYMTFSMGQNEASTSARLSASARRYSEMRFYGDGKLRLYWNSLGSYKDVTSTVGGVNTLTWFLNDYDSQSVNYAMGGTTYTLPANSLAWWVNGSLVLNGTAEYGSLDLADATVGGTVGTSEGNLGRIGFSDTSVTGMNYFFDDIVVAQIPEPATISMLLIGVAGLVAVRRFFK